MRLAVVAAAAALTSACWITTANAAPQISSVFPASGPTAGNAIITIVGTNFAPAGNAVMVGPNECHVTGESPAQITCELPEGSGASRPIRVIDGVGTASPPFPFSYAPPEVTNIMAASAPTAGGVLITINGANFGADGVARRVTIDGKSVCTGPSTVVAHGSVSCTLPPGQGTNLAVEMAVDGQTSTINGTLGYDGPAITAVTPTHGRAIGGTPLTIDGANFGASANVLIGATPCPVEVQTDDHLECNLPPETPGAASDVRVLVSGQASGTFPFSYQAVASKCDTAKFKAASAYTKCLGTADANAAKKGLQVAAAAVAKCDDKMTASCAKAESASGDCSQPGTCAALALKIKHRGWDGLIYGNTR